jgi:hypothetical protein
MWWTTGGARVSPMVLSTHGLPAAHEYGAFLADADMQRTPGTSSSTPSVAPVLDRPAASHDGVDDVLADLLALPSSADAATPAVDMRGEPQSGVEQTPPATVSVGHRRERQVACVVADNGAAHPRRQAAARVSAALAEGATDMRDVRELLSALHPTLRERGEDLIDPVPEDAAVVVASVANGCAELLRAGAAGAWHWRHGQLRPLFTADVDADMATFEADTLRRGDLAGILSPTPVRHMSGIGGADALRLDEVHCNVERGDRLLLMATDTLLRLPDDAIAGALHGGSGEEVRARIAAAADLGDGCAQWPVAVIEVGT